jgi:S1-C subfamily serine protease/rhodanese-related sulfurtransferase
MSARASRVPWALMLAASAGLAAMPSLSDALSVQETLLVDLPAVALVSAEVKASVTVNCGQGPITISPKPFIEVGTGWFVDGRGYLITNAHVIDPAYRVPPWVEFDLKLRAVEQGCVDPALKTRGLTRGQRPDLEEELLRAIPLAGVKLTPTRRVSVLLSNGANLEAQVAKFSAPITLDAKGTPLKDSGRDLALLKIPDGAYPALSITDKEPKVGDELRILGFPGVVRDHELLSRSALKEASATKGEVSGFNTDAIGQDVIQTDAAAVHGNSGGPAVDDSGLVVGVMTFVSLRGNAAVQGFNFLIPAKDVRAFLAGTDVTPGESRFNPVWAAGVTALFEERYSVALEKFREADRLLPGLAVVKRSMKEAEYKLAHPPPRPFPWGWTIAGAVTVLSLVAWGVWAGRRWKRNRFRVHPSQVVDFLERGLNPIMLDVRVPGDYETSPLSIPKAIRLDPDQVARGPIDLDIDKKQLIVTFCTSPEERTSAEVTRLLRRQGWSNVRILKGGLGAWANARLPVESKSHLPSVGIEIYRNLTTHGDIERRHFAPGAVVFEEGDDAHGEAYLVHSGAIEIVKRYAGGERRLNLVKEGGLLGEMALFRHAPRSAAAVAVTETELLVIRNEWLEWLIRNKPELTLELLKQLSDQVVAGNQGVASPVAPAATPTSSSAPPTTP